MNAHTLVCAACRAIDQADGVEDGNLFPVLSRRVGHERKAVQALVDAQDRIADRVTSFAGSLKFVYIHTVWFGIWILLNVGALGATLAFDKFPFGLLTMIVSLEAIFLSTFVMVSQNRQSERADVRSQLDFETNLRAETGPCTSARPWGSTSTTWSRLSARRSKVLSSSSPAEPLGAAIEGVYEPFARAHALPPAELASHPSEAQIVSEGMDQNLARLRRWSAGPLPP